MAIQITKGITQRKLNLSDFNDDLNYISDAPADDKQYARQNNAWAEVTSMRGVAVFVQSTEPTSKELHDIWIKI